ncbi:unnamed protein product [Clonostachys chloroleuca]|uniref:Vacuolar membrane-associated protein IML1 n=1 Tax=Clonostachys chloroleuca TaxID=1926264 RepID=A0AA35M3Y0_9HYPO|nr:unnamed protein product [Clonostachys chloroleuca]
MSLNAPLSASRRGPQWTRLRHASRSSQERSSSDPPGSPRSTSTHSTIKESGLRQSRERYCTVSTYEGFSREEVFLNFDRLGGDVKAGALMAVTAIKGDSIKSSQTYGSLSRHSWDSGPRESPRDPTFSLLDQDYISSRYVFLAKDMPKEMKSRYPDVDVTVAKHIADAFGIKRGSRVLLAPINQDNPAIQATHVELFFKDQYLSRADQWRLTVGELNQRTVYKGQSILFLGTIKAQVTAVFVNGRRVHSGYFTRDTRPIFRSESARFVLFIQMSQEMWDFDSRDTGEIMFNKVVNGFLPALFKRWATLRVKHLVSIVLFARVEYDTGLATDLAYNALDSDYYTGAQNSGSKRPYKDFYRVVVSEMSSGEWTSILHQLKKESNYFRRDISLHHHEAQSRFKEHMDEEDSKNIPVNTVKAESSPAMYGNLLEAINLASSQFANDYVDRDLTRTGISIMILTPGSGVFEVDYETLRRTTESLVNNGIGIDLICLPQMPLHSVPLFKFRNPQYSEDKFRGQHHSGMSKSFHSRDSTPLHQTPVVGSYQSIPGSLSPSKASSLRQSEVVQSLKTQDAWCYALPQWLHVSYWTGTSDEALSYEGIAVTVSNEVEKDGDDEFVMRCRMYDLQMRSVLETNEIETKPLHADPLFPQKLTLPPSSPKARRGMGSTDVVYLPNRRSPETLYEYVYGFLKFSPDRLVKPGEKSLWKQLKEYDETRAKLPRHKRPHHSSRHVDLDEDTKRQLTEDSRLFGTSVPEQKPTISVKSSRKASMNILDADKPGLAAVAQMKSQAKANAAPRAFSSIKAPKFLRQISLGQRGFGVAAPKAAIAEVKAETVNASDRFVVEKMAPSMPLINTSLRPSSPKTITSRESSISARPRKLETQVPPTFEKLPATPSIPISRAASSINSKDPPAPPSAVPGSFSSRIEGSVDDRDVRHSNALRAEDAQKVYTNKLRAGVGPELPATLSPTTAITPWLTLLNPSKPERHRIDDTILYSRWQHIFPQTSEMKVQKWKALCCPAAVPLTTEYFPTKTQFDVEYQRHPYNVDQNLDDDMEEPKSRQEFMKELISLRLSQGFQVVVGPAVAKAFGQKLIKIADIFSRDQALEDGTSVFMSIGNTIHELACVNGTEVEVNIYIRKPPKSSSTSDGFSLTYKPAIRTLLDEGYQTCHIEILRPNPDRNWNTIDSFLAGHHDEMMESLRFWRARFVLIPQTSRQSSNPKLHVGDSPEEIRIEGIKRLACLWQKNRYIPPADRPYQRPGFEQSPLNIIYKTEDPSVVIAAELETLPIVEGAEGIPRKWQLVSSKDRFQKSNLNLSALAEAMQQPPENGGVPLRNRRWHIRSYSHSFIGSEMVTWLLDNFEDLESREEAEALGNALMVHEEPKNKEKEANEKSNEKSKGLFVHVEKRHQFRDGNYFYQLSSEYSKGQSGWFNKRKDPHLSSQLSDVSSPRTATWPPEDRSPVTSSPVPAVAAAQSRTKRPPRVELSKVIKYDLDSRKRSYHPERVDLHYDRLHNPDNCFHIRIDWMNVTAKLVQDAVEGWAREASQYGLRLVEVPIKEAASIAETNPFRRPYRIKLALPPPEQKPETYLDGSSNKHFYQIAILKKLDFVLDMEAASCFPSNVEVRYSWGVPDYKYSQYIHRTGALMVQILDSGDFIVLANRLYNTRVFNHREQVRAPASATGEPTFFGGRIISSSSAINLSEMAAGTSSPLVRPAFYQQSPALKPVHPWTSSSSNFQPPLITEPELIKDELERFCQDAATLEEFYRETFERGQAVPSTPSTLGPASILEVVPESSIPSLGLPPGVLGESSLGSGGSVRLPGALPFLRRGSVQIDGLGLGSKGKGN